MISILKLTLDKSYLRKLIFKLDKKLYNDLYNIKIKKPKKILLEKIDKPWIISGILNDKKYTLWPKCGSDILCWNCTRMISHQVPIGIPYKENSDGVLMFGCFCSFQCALSWNNSVNEKIIINSTKTNRELLLRKIYKACGGIDVIIPAPPKELLIKYGGPYTDNEYEIISNSNNINISIYSKPFISMCPTYETINKTDYKPIKYKKYKFNRTKPLYT